MQKEVFLTNMPEYNAFGIADDIINQLRESNITPIIKMHPSFYELLKCPKPDEKAPTVAFLLGREKDCYTIDYPYAKAIAQSGVNIRFLTYNENLSQMQKINGLILPGGSFDSPEEFYANHTKEKSHPQSRSFAYITSIMEAEKNNLPILGICAGAQMIGGMHKMKLVKELKNNTDMEHKNKEKEAHIVKVDTNSPLYQILNKEYILTNSRHREGMVNFDKMSDLKIYATTRDGTPEAWGNEEKNILCIQWHPEDFASQGDKAMQNIYNWLAQKSKENQKQQQNTSKTINILNKHKDRIL